MYCSHRVHVIFYVTKCIFYIYIIYIYIYLLTVNCSNVIYDKTICYIYNRRHYSTKNRENFKINLWICVISNKISINKFIWQLPFNQVTSMWQPQNKNLNVFYVALIGFRIILQSFTISIFFVAGYCTSTLIFKLSPVSKTTDLREWFSSESHTMIVSIV